MEFDVFLSHNSHDKPAVRELAKRLTKRRIRVWLDEDQLIPGRNWQPLLEDGIKQSASGAVLVGKDGFGPWEDEEMQALLRQAVSQGKPVIPVLLPGAPTQPQLPMFLLSRTWVDLREGFTGPGMERLVWGITGTRPGRKADQADTGGRRIASEEGGEAPTSATAQDHGASTSGGHAPISPERQRLLLAFLVAVFALVLFWWFGPWTPVREAPVTEPGAKPAAEAVLEQTLAGSVRNEANDPIEGVEVSVPEFGATARTDRLGRFKLQVTAPYQRIVQLMAQYKDYQTYRQHVMLGSENLDFKLMRRSP